MAVSGPYAFISDVHSNLEALCAVFDNIERRGVSDVCFIGDAVGYGPDPNECLDLLKERCRAFVAGNHDWAVLGYTPTDYFNPNARAAIEWTVNVISEEGIAFLKSFGIIKVIPEGRFFLVHATPKDPDSWNYIRTLYDAEVNFHYFEEHACISGHSHMPVIIERLPSGEFLHCRDRVRHSETSRYLINAGSVGQPRDGDPRASYVIISGDDIEIIRVDYDFCKTQIKMREAGLPESLIERLERGV